MQTTDNVTTRYEGSPTGQAFGQAQGTQALAPQATLADYKVIRRNGTVVSFEPSKISIAVTKAFLAVNGGQGAASARVRELVEQLTANVVNALIRRQPSGEHDVARAYVLYRAKRMEERAQQQATKAVEAPQIHVVEGGQRRPLELD